MLYIVSLFILHPIVNAYKMFINSEELLPPFEGTSLLPITVDHNIKIQHTTC
jgi:hypothetical protein